MNIEKSIALVRVCAERLRAAELSVGPQTSDLEDIPPTLGTRVLERKGVSMDDHQPSRKGNEQQQNDDLV
ncbi:MAG TPA: hypothetical protein VGK24_17705 [Candidatus Angelobacter sp.]